MDRVLDDAASGVDLSRKEAVVLLILSSTEAEHIDTADLVATFGSWYISRAASAAKDVSVAKRRLFLRDLVGARHSPRNISLTEKGWVAVNSIIGLMHRAVRELKLAQADVALLSSILGAPVGLPSGRATAADSRDRDTQDLKTA